MNRRLFTQLFCLALLTAGCGPSTMQQETEAQGSAEQLTIKGSDTMVHLLAVWAEEFMEARPNIGVSITGGGSGTGIAALLNNTTDLAAASRDMTQEEKEQASRLGIKVREFVVARDAIAVVVHPSNPVAELTIDQLRQIYTGEISQWTEVGGSGGAILLLSRESSSGTYIFFQEHVLKKQDFAGSARLMPSTSAIIQAVGEDASAIGYVGLGYAHEAGNRVKVLKIKPDAQSPGVMPSEESVRQGTYTVSRPLYLYSREPVSAQAASFVEFSLSDTGQAIVRETGYVPVK